MFDHSPNESTKLEASSSYFAREIDEATKAARTKSPGDPLRPSALNTLALIFNARFQALGAQSDLDQTIQLQKETIELTQDDDPTLVLWLDNLGLWLLERFVLRGEKFDLDEAIRNTNRAISNEYANYYGERAVILHNNSLQLRARYKLQGDPVDLEHAINNERESIRSFASDGRQCLPVIDSLSILLVDRYEATRNLQDVEEAIRLSRQVVTATSEEDPSWGTRVNHLCIALGECFAVLHESVNIEEAIDRIQSAIQRAPKGGHNRIRWLNNLGSFFRQRYRQYKIPIDFEKAADTIQQAILELPTTHRDRPRMLFNLGNAWLEKYEDEGGSASLNEAIESFVEAVQSTPLEEPDRTMRLNKLGSVLTNRFLIDNNFDDLFLAKQAHCLAGEIANGPPLDRATAHHSLAALLTGEGRHAEAAEEYENAVMLLGRISPRSLPRADQQRVLNAFSGLPCNAATSAIRADWPALKALQILESGRCIIAGFSMSARSDVALLKEKYPILCERYEGFRASFSSVQTRQGTQTNEGYLALAETRERALRDLTETENEVRKLPGFERFQMALDGTDCLRLAESGPIVVFNVSQKRSDAIIIDHTIRSIHLKDLHHSDMVTNLKSLSTSRTSRRRNMEDPVDDDEDSEHDQMPDLASVLLWLWNVAVNPVLDELGPSGQRRRIWWVTCGLMSVAPIHAAGDHSENSLDYTMNHVMSSYISSVKALQYARARQRAPLDSTKRMLLVTMPKTLGASKLNVEPEVEAITTTFGSSVTSFQYAQKDEVLKSLPSFSFAHFACHGKADTVDPSQGGLTLLDKDRNVTLTISELDDLDLQHAEIAYLSACSTAELSGKDFVDEAIHLANSFQVIGFRHVIGTMWATDDKAAGEIAKDFYRSIKEQLKDPGKELMVPEALHNAVLKLRAKKIAKHDNLADWFEWTPFIHVGI